jgi:hypothetical protein
LAAGGSWDVSSIPGGQRVELRPEFEAARVPDRVIGDSLAGLRTKRAVHRVRVALHLDEGQHLIGLGERYDRLDQRGNRLDVRVYEPYPSRLLRA